MSYRKKVMVALEEAGLDTPVQEELVPAAAQEVEAASAEVNGEMVEADDMLATVDDAAGEVEALGDVQDLMQEAVDSGEGMTEQTAEMAEVAIERIMDKLGFAKRGEVMPAMESFGNKGSRLSATKVALESVSENLKKAGRAIINFLKQIWEKLKSFFAGLIKSRSALAKNLASLQKRAKELKDSGAVKKEAELKSGAAKALSVDGKADLASASKVLEDSAKLATVGQTLAVVLTQAAKSFDPMKAESIDKEMAAGIEKALASLPSVKGEGDKAHFGNLIGGKSVGFTKAAGEDKSKVDMSIDTIGKGAEKAAALDADEVIKLLAEADVVLKTLNNYDKVDKELQAVTKSAIDHMNKLVNLNEAASKGDKGGEEAHKDVAKVVAGAREVANVASKVGLTFPGLIFNAVKAATDYASHSMNNMGDKEAKKEDKEDKK